MIESVQQRAKRMKLDHLDLEQTTVLLELTFEYPPYGTNYRCYQIDARWYIASSSLAVKLGFDSI